MQPDQLFTLSGDVVAGQALRADKARALYKVLRRGDIPYVHLVEARYLSTLRLEAIVIDVEPELPQHLVEDIRPVERIAMLCGSQADSLPLVLALRRDFPTVPHLFLTARHAPKGLCLSETPLAEQRLNWTPATQLGALRRWLHLTARGELHDPAQVLEPLFLTNADRVLLPAAFFEAGHQALPAHLTLYVQAETPAEKVYRAYTPGSAESAASTGQPVVLLGFTYEAQAQLHGLIREEPANLADLHCLLAVGGDNLLGHLQELLAGWHTQADLDLDCPLLGLVRVPMLRTPQAAAEVLEVWAFATTLTAQQVSMALAAPDSPDEQMGQEVAIRLLNPAAMLTPVKAAEYNGLTSNKTAYVAIGVGSLGSQIVATLHKAGHGTWDVVDEDVLLPHNLPRYELGGRYVGWAKAEALATELNLLYEAPRVRSHVLNVLNQAADLSACYAAATVLLDMSASVAVARHLALDVVATARRISVFINPAGTDLVVLAESADRKLRLDYLEMEYYWALATQLALANHLGGSQGFIRYANGCRDKSARISQEQVALLAAVGARAVRAVGDATTALLKIWQTQPDLAVSAVVIEPARYRQYQHPSGWTLHLSHRLLQDIAAHRATRLRHGTRQFRETGGVLLGLFDTQRRQLYVVAHLPAPADSLERHDSFIRGTETLAADVAGIALRTNYQLSYVGEWHSHPPHYPTRPSTDDRKVFAWLCAHRAADGLPAVMAIVGDDSSSWYVDDLAQGRVHAPWRV